MMPESNQRTSVPHFAWFHPGNNVTSTKSTDFYVFRGTPTIQEGNIAIPVVNDALNKLTTQPTEPTKKKPKTSKELKLQPLKKSPSKSNVDVSRFPVPVCTCTGVPRQCYRGGAGGWQSSCCTINISEYPLPMSTTRPGSRMAGRKMTRGVYDRILHKLAGEGYDISNPIDLKDHWAKRGTNKFVTMK